jgi:hypothetical protein
VKYDVVVVCALSYVRIVRWILIYQDFPATYIRKHAFDRRERRGGDEQLVIVLKSPVDSSSNQWLWF